MSEEKSVGFGFDSYIPKAEEPKVEEVKEVKAEKPKKKKAEPKKVEAVKKPAVTKEVEAEVLYGASKIRAKRAKRGA